MFTFCHNPDLQFENNFLGMFDRMTDTKQTQPFVDKKSIIKPCTEKLHCLKVVRLVIGKTACVNRLCEQTFANRIKEEGGRDSLNRKMLNFGAKLFFPTNFSPTF